MAAVLFAEIQFNRILEAANSPTTIELYNDLRENRASYIQSLKVAITRTENPVTTVAQVDELIAQVRQGGSLTLATLEEHASKWTILGIDTF